jgi:hypothetical protein
MGAQSVLNNRHSGISVGICRNSPPPQRVRNLFLARIPDFTSPELQKLARPAIIVGSLPCELFASTVAAQHDVVYVMVTESLEEEPAGANEWVDGLLVTPGDAESIIAFGELILARKASSFRPRPIVSDCGIAWRGQLVSLSPLECRLMRRLATEAGSVVTRDILARDLWDNVYAAGRSVDAHIYRMRRRLAALKGVRIETVHKRGFRLILE